MSDDEVKAPKVGDEVLFKDDDGDYTFATIEEVGDFNDDTGLYSVETEAGPFEVYWSDEDENWVQDEE